MLSRSFVIVSEIIFDNFVILCIVYNDKKLQSYML